MAKGSPRAEMLQQIQLLIILAPNLIGEFVRELVDAVERAGLTAYPRAEGFAFMRDESVGRLGLPHLRCAVMRDRVVVWVRDPYNLRSELLNAAGLNADEYFEELVRAAGEMAKVYEKYRALASGFLVRLP